MVKQIHNKVLVSEYFLRCYINSYKIICIKCMFNDECFFLIFKILSVSSNLTSFITALVVKIKLSYKDNHYKVVYKQI